MPPTCDAFLGDSRAHVRSRAWGVAPQSRPVAGHHRRTAERIVIRALPPLALVASAMLALASDARAADELPRTTLALHMSIASRRDGVAGIGLVAALEGEHRIVPAVGLGAYVETTLGTGSFGDRTYYSRTGLFDYRASGPMAALHGIVGHFDFWMRAAVGLAIVGEHVGGHHFRDHSILAIQFRGEVGIDLRLGHFLIGPTASLSSFTARNGDTFALGLRIGGGW